MHSAANAKQQKHFVLVHGGCLGAWIWYKLKPLLESAGHKVTAVDLSAAGINPRRLDEIHTFRDYSEPLMEVMASIPPDEKVVLLGHSFGGMSLGLAMETYPEKISVAVFMSAMMPDPNHSLTYPFEKYNEKCPADMMLDSQFSTYGNPENPGMSMILGPQFMALKMFQNCSVEDLELAKMLTRPGSLFFQDLAKAKKFSTERYGSVKRAYIFCNEDKSFPVEFQKWFVESVGADKVKEIKEADHMGMLSQPREVCKCLLDISDS
uniref:Polyneuridine aldehyde esterase n=1 Tax=Rauvolfia serpentina TaxID=4060 RepID=PNAE_RAUSE|nr:RecName: Full=Polyneuridine-aldehyde esterase; AltName: Full=Polyneuridine aldehyde esterase; Flags: Precursor [Rauvolfia serpentina]AAF22288.1 polyneuridine aldehyde esterase [Rauvolfia serpentina]